MQKSNKSMGGGAITMLPPSVPGSSNDIVNLK